MPERRLISAIAGANTSVSYTLSKPLRTQTVRSSPMPVSTFFLPRGSYTPSALLLYCMKTLFHISRYFPQSQAGEQSAQHFSLPVSQKISVSGPQGPVVPAIHQLFFFGRKKICPSFKPHSRHIFADSSSRGASASPSKTETASLFASSPRYSSDVKNSKLHLIDCSLK